jgi:hypothetical protein
MDKEQHLIKPDPDTGKCPTARQLHIMMLLNPYSGDSCKTYEEVAEKLGVSHQAISERMRRLKIRCPNIYQRFRECRFKQHKRWHKTGCKFCGADIPVGQPMCFLCWKARAKKKNPNQYFDYFMYPVGGGPTRNTITWEKDKHYWERIDRG